MKTQKIFAILVLLLVVVASCKKIDNTPKPVGDLTMNELVIPESFNWETYKDLTLKISIETSQTVSAFSKVSVYKGNPDTDGSLVVSGSASADKDFVSQIRIPSRLEELYLRCEFPFGLTRTEMIPVSGNLIAYTFSDVKTSPFTSDFKSTTDVGPECDDCDLVISGSGSYDIGNGQKVCVTDDFTGSVTFQSWNGGGTLQICGTATINNLQLTEDAHIIVTQSGTLTIGNFSAWGTRGTITVYENASLYFNNDFMTQGDGVEIQGHLEVDGNMTIQNLTSGVFVNTGSVFVNGNVQVNTNHTLVNYGIFKAEGTHFHLNNSSNCENSGTIDLTSATSNHLEVNQNSVFTNNGVIDVEGNISINAGSTILNNCAMMCSGTFAVNTGDFKTYSGFLKGAQNMNLNQTSNIEIHDGSMISTENMTMNTGGVIGTGSLNSIYVTGTLTIHSNNVVSGPIETATDNLVISIGGIPEHFINGATVVGLDHITNYIEPNDCNPDGIGMNSVIEDADGDGVPDDLDDYPNDFYRAFNNYFPDENGYVTLVFEDLWPATGDYDFNDLVLGVYGVEVANANNDIVEIDINFNVLAVGASFQNGFGWQYANITPSAVEQVTGAVLRAPGESYVSNAANGTELSQDSAVIIAVENIEDVLNRAGGSMFNTLDNGLIGTSDLVEVNILFGETTPIDRDLFGPAGYNVFLIKNGVRGTEIHLADRQPTDLMTTPLGTGHDTSDPLTNRYFKTATNLPWGLMLMEPFSYPVEQIPIIDAYPDFASWAQSGGTTHTDWYNNPDPTKVWTP